jgi:hypothetical protein
VIATGSSPPEDPDVAAMDAEEAATAPVLVHA